MNEHITIYEELLPHYLAHIHDWLMDDVMEAMNTSMKEPLELLRKFSFLLYGHAQHFVLVDEKNDQCIGVILFERQIGHLELKLFSIAPEYRKKGLGKRFALTAIDIVRKIQPFKIPIRVYPFNDSTKFWGAIGFDRIDDNYMELKREVPFEIC